MPGKAELRKLAIDLQHDPVARDLGDDAGGGDRERAGVALDDGIVRPWEITHGQAVDEAVIRLAGETFDRAAHREVGGAQDIQAVDFPDIRSGHRPDEIRMTGERGVQFFAAGRAELFGIIEARANETRWQNDRCGRHRAGEWPAPGLVHTGDPAEAAGLQGGFEGQVGHGMIRSD